MGDQPGHLVLLAGLRPVCSGTRAPHRGLPQGQVKERAGPEKRREEREGRRAGRSGVGWGWGWGRGAPR